MAREVIDSSSFSPDILDFIRLLHAHEVRYLIVGGEAVIYYGHARLTGDVDFFYDRDPENARRLHAALDEFWSGSIPGLSGSEELTEQGLIIQFGVPPNRIDLLNRIDAVDFAEAWARRTSVSLDDDDDSVPVHYLGLAELIRNKEGAGRPKDLDDLPFLKEALKLRVRES